LTWDPDIEIFGEVEICYSYDTSLILGKLTLFLSTLYDTYLPFALYGPSILPVVVMGTTLKKKKEVDGTPKKGSAEK
jgi:hypothetical protein